MLSLATASAGFAGEDLVRRFNDWKTAHRKSYHTVDAEHEALAGFVHNDALIQEHNAKGLSFWLGHNEFSDLKFDEFQARHMAGGLGLHTNRSPKNADRVHLTGENGNGPPADSVDWVARGAVTGVKNQGQCGSCWAFSTTGSMEGANFLRAGKLTSFSEEDLVQCDNAAHGGEDQGCQGGLMDNAFEWIEKNGLCTEAAYPYTSGSGLTGKCKKACTPAVTVSKFKDVPKGDEVALKSAVAQQPVSIAVDASGFMWQLYKGGVFDHALCGKQLDHGVLLVGYGAEGKDYWKLKNSWGTTWGLEGYMHIAKGKNMCGLANSASYPTTKAYSNATRAAPAPKPRSAGQPHYGDPKDGCRPDETETSIQGIAGDFCTPKCSLFTPCPTDVPRGVTAKPECALQDASNQKYCALICSTEAPILDQKAADAQCGDNASCKTVQKGIGLCTYDD